MPIFTELHFEDQQRLYHEAAHQMAAKHQIVPATITPLAFVNNATFQVVSAAQRRYALRIYRPHQSSASAIRSELRWLEALRAETELQVPHPIMPPSDDALDALLRVKLPESSDALYGVLFDWLEGATRPAAHHTPEQAERIGAAIGQLHAHSRAFSYTANYPRRKLTADQFVFWRLIEEHTPSLFSPAQHRILAEAEAQIKAVFEAFSPMDYGLIHADIICKNLVIDDQRISLIDFESCAWGYYAYDLAPLLLDYLREPHYPELRAALLAGYRQVQPLELSDAALDVLIAARLTLSCFWIAQHLDNPELEAQAPATVARRLAEVSALLNLEEPPVELQA
ncbi:MAG: phosphotransferase [Herpetosiphonaceae bacterium]|nr:phosphotransferase [Herpetosiphonaceae bacterium]